MPRFAANLGYLFTERPLLERIDAAAAAGFKAIELQFPYDVPASAVKAAIEKNKLTILGLNTPPGEREGEFGFAAVPGREKDWQTLFSRALDYASAIGASAIHCLAGKVAPEQRPAANGDLELALATHELHCGPLFDANRGVRCVVRFRPEQAK